MFVTILSLLLIVRLAILALLVVTLLAGFGFLGIGWVFSYFFSLEQYEATIVALGVSIVLLFLTYIVAYATNDMDMDESEEGEESEEEEYELPILKRPVHNFKKRERKRKSSRH